MLASDISESSAQQRVGRRAGCGKKMVSAAAVVRYRSREVVVGYNTHKETDPEHFQNHSAEQQKKTCGSTVFSTGHPRQYSLAPAMLVCADRTRRGRFIAVWPQMKWSVCASYIYPFPLSHRQPSAALNTCLVHVIILEPYGFDASTYYVAM